MCTIFRYSKQMEVIKYRSKSIFGFIRISCDFLFVREKNIKVYLYQETYVFTHGIHYISSYFMYLYTLSLLVRTFD